MHRFNVLMVRLDGTPISFEAEEWSKVVSEAGRIMNDPFYTRHGENPVMVIHTSDGTDLETHNPLELLKGVARG